MTACQPRHRHQELLAFLRRIVRELPEGELHLVLDNSSTHTTPEVECWLARHKRVHFHFTPTSASWMNLVESWFSILTRQQVRRASYASVDDLIAAIERFVAGLRPTRPTVRLDENSRPHTRKGRQTATDF